MITMEKHSSEQSNMSSGEEDAELRCVSPPVDVARRSCQEEAAAAEHNDQTESAGGVDFTVSIDSSEDWGASENMLESSDVGDAASVLRLPVNAALRSSEEEAKEDTMNQSTTENSDATFDEPTTQGLLPLPLKLDPRSTRETLEDENNQIEIGETRAVNEQSTTGKGLEILFSKVLQEGEVPMALRRATQMTQPTAFQRGSQEEANHDEPDGVELQPMRGLSPPLRSLRPGAVAVSGPGMPHGNSEEPAVAQPSNVNDSNGLIRAVLVEEDNRDEQNFPVLVATAIPNENAKCPWLLATLVVILVAVVVITSVVLTSRPGPLPKTTPNPKGSLPPSTDQPTLAPSPEATPEPMPKVTLEPTPEPTPQPTTPDMDARFCDDLWCWVHLGSDLKGDYYLDGFGQYVSFARNGTRLAVSAPLYDRDHLSDVGFVRVYDVIGSSGNLASIDEAIYGQSGDKTFGVLSRGGGNLAVAAPQHDRNYADLAEAGQVRIFHLRSNSWELMGQPIYGENGMDHAGRSVALSYDGDTVAIGAPRHEGKGGESSGHVRIYSYENSDWVQKGFDIDGEAAWDWSGGAVSLSDDGSVVAVGAENSNDAGHVRVFHFISGSWSQLGSDINGQDEGDEFGSCVSLSSDGRTVGAGAWAAYDDTGKDTGHVRIFSFNESTSDWEQLGANINGKAARDNLCTLSLAANGRRVAVSAPAALTGYVLVYDYIMGEWRQLGGTLTGEITGEMFGADISLSFDGTRLAVGASSMKADPPKGAVRLYELRPLEQVH